MISSSTPTAGRLHVSTSEQTVDLQTADLEPVDLERAALDAGWRDTVGAITRWRREPVGTIVPWVLVSFGVGVALLVATGLIAVVHADSDVPLLPAFSGTPDFEGVANIFTRNLLVLALHALVCVAGYLAMRSVPTVADAYSGWVQRLHLAAPPIAMSFVSLATLGSLTIQALALGELAASVAAAYDLPPRQLLVLLLPHALPELTALFLPLGAWIVLARRRAWNDLLAASVVTTTLAVPVLVIAAITEVYVTPLLVLAA